MTLEGNNWLLWLWLLLRERYNRMLECCYTLFVLQSFIFPGSVCDDIRHMNKLVVKMG